MKVTLLIIGVWLIMWYVTAAGFYAFLTTSFPRLNSRRDRREDMAFCAGISLIPVAWVIVPFMTGFYMDGFYWGWYKSPPLREI